MPEKKLYDLTVDPEFRDLIPPLNEEELKLLEESLVADGCESPLIVWNGVIIDGHNRYAICRKHDIPFSIQEKNFDTREEVMLWMLRNQLGRRNLNNYQRSELALKFEPLFAHASEKRMLAGKLVDPPQNSAEGQQVSQPAYAFQMHGRTTVQISAPVHFAGSYSDFFSPAGCAASRA